MSGSTPRLRMFAGPNGSGKSTIKSPIRPEILGVYVNPDEIEKEIGQRDSLDLRPYAIQTNTLEVQAFCRTSTLAAKAGLLDGVLEWKVADAKLDGFAVPIDSYIASVIADFLRQKLFQARIAFTFETVMSSPDKVELLRRSQAAGYRTYLYYVATDDPSINISRVRNRVRTGGHGVPEDKIVSRYHRSLDLLPEAIRHSNRAFLFDNSGLQHVWVAEITDGKDLEMKTVRMPDWFKKAVWDKMPDADLGVK